MKAITLSKAIADVLAHSPAAYALWRRLCAAGWRALNLLVVVAMLAGYLPGITVQAAAASGSAAASLHASGQQKATPAPTESLPPQELPTLLPVIPITATDVLWPTATPTASLTPEPTHTPLPAETLTATLTATPTLTPTPAFTITATIAPTPEMTATATATPMPEPTLAPTVTLTPTATATPGITVTVTPTPTLVITSTPPVVVAATAALTLTFAGQSSLVLSVSPASINPGDVFTLTWALHTPDKQAEKLALSLIFPPGMQPVENSGYEPATRLLRLSLAGAGRLQAAASVDAVGPFALQVAVIQPQGEAKARELAAGTLTIAEDGVAALTANGGQVSGLHGKVKVHFPKGAYLSAEKGKAEGLDVRVRPLGAAYAEAQRKGGYEEPLPPYTLSGSAFEISAWGQSEKESVHKFTEPITIEVQYDESQISGDESTLRLFYYDTQWETWLSLPGWTDTEANIIYAHSDHLSTFDFDTQNWEASRLPTLKGFQVSSFTGAATYSFPIQVPPGPGGLQPSLSLSYNSQVVDSASALTQASWAGMGWSIDIGYMQRNQNGTPNEPSDDTFNLTFNGVSTMVVKGTDGKYYASDQNFMRIEYIVTGDPNIGQDEVSYWVVWDKTGSKYYFGENSNDANYSNRANYMAWDGCSGGQPINLHRTTWRWALNRVTNIYGQSLIYRNANQGKTISSICDESEQNAVDQAAYPVDITYSNNRYRIFFVRQENRTDWDHDWNVGLSSQNFFERSRLKEIQVQHDANGNGFGDDALVRKYVLTYADEQGVNPIFKNLVWSEGGKTLTLMRITEYGYNGAGPLPATNFIYGDNMHLTQATNGYGGRVDFTYEAWYETTTTDSLAFIHHFGALDNPCYGGSSTGGWGGINGGSAFCTGGGDLQINNTGQKGMPASMIRPGSYYLLSATLKGVVGGDTARISMSNGGVTQDLALLSLTDGWQTTSGYLKLPTDADKYSAWQLKTYTHAQMNWFIARPVVTRYRVVSKTVTDDILPNGTTGKTITSTYRYDEPATNDDNHSANASVAETSQYVKEYSEFRGHGMVQERVSGMPATTTFFYQDDNRKGSAATTLVHTQDLGDSFNSLSDANWDWDASSTSLTRLAGDHAVKLYGDADWNAFYRSPATISTNRMAMVQFKVSDATGAAVIGLEDPADVNNRWAIKASGSTIQAQYHDGSGWQYPASMTLERNQWYVVLLIADNDEFFLRVWKRDDPSKVMRYQCAPATCSLPTDVTWRFKAWALNGDLYLDEYLEGYLLSLNDSLYATTTNIPVAPLPIGSYGDIRIAWTYLTESKSLAFNFDAQWVGTRSEYHYVTSDQGNAQYGNCTRTYESHWVNNGWQNYRWSVTRYYPNTTGSVYLVGLPGYSNTYHCPGGSCDWDASNLVSHTKYIYDANTTNSAPPTQGKLTKQRTLLRYAGADYTDPRYSDTAFAYDDYGNQTTVTVYPTEGNDDSFGQGTPQNTYTCYGSGDELDGTPCTDDGYHTYVKWTKNDKDHKTDLTYNYAISLPTGETDPNGNVTSATYDDFGRLKTIVRPGDDATNPTVRITYPAYGETFGLNDPFYTQAEQHITGGSYFKILKYYNGLGQILQTQVVGAVLKDDACSTDADLLPDTCDILGDTYYDEAGRLSKQAVPLAVAYGQFSYHQTDHNTNRSATTTTYDAAGRPYTVTAPDETFTRTTYGDGYDTISGSGYQVTWIRDPRGNYTATRTDLFGRTILVDAPGPDVSYTYDAADRLLTATRGGATVTLAYDLGGRKKSMADPDMGNWAYTYNALGSLLTQTDARGCVITMGYDNLNRLTSKAYGSSNCGSGNSSVNYYYDEGGASAEELGRRTRMTDASGSTTWDYDTRGRTTREVKTINGTSYTTQWTYNSADLPVTMTYPDGEVVTHTYHRQLLLDKLMSNRDANNAANNYYLVQDSLYDEAGRITRRDLGAANTGTNPVLVSAQHYTPWTTDGGRMDYMKTGTYADPGQNNLLNLTYDYDANGNILTIVDGVNIGQKQCFTYDTLNRLTKGTTFNDSALGCTTQLGQGNYDESYTYNGTTGNLASKVGVDYDYDTPLDSAHPHAVKWLEMPATGSTATAITIRARGSVAGNIWPTMELWVNQVKVRTWTVSATSYTDYTFTPNLTGRDQIDVVFTNDGVVGSEDRNLYVDYVKVGATTYQAETVMIMDRGGSTDAFDGHLVQAGSEMLPWSAALRFVVGTGGTSVGYDKNGSMTYKLAAGDAKVFTYDAENRMVEARKNGAVIATFTYDGDGNQVKAVENNVTTLYVGGHYEVSGNTIKKYYTAGGTRIAMRDNGTLRYLLTDHLGSTSVVADANGTKLSEMRYKPWGEVRFTSGTMPTDRTYTGQRSEMDTLGLMFYQARFYDPSLGRFAQADSVFPNSIQGLDRYAYANNSPINFNDPSGHDAMFVGGYSSDDWKDPFQWREWVMAYKGWDEYQWDSFYRAWTKQGVTDADKEKLMSDTGVHFFNWNACDCAIGDGYFDRASSKATMDWARDDLARQMDGMEDITLVGHSKGGNLVTSYVQSGKGPRPKNAVIIDSPISPNIIGFGAGADALMPSVIGSGVRTVNIFNYWDPVNGGPTGFIFGAENYLVFRMFEDTFVHGIKGYLANEVISSLNVMYDHGNRLGPDD